MDRAQQHEIWFKQKTWVCIPHSSGQKSNSDTSSSRLCSPVRVYRELLNQSSLLQIREQVANQCAIAFKQQSSSLPSSMSGEPSSQIDQLKDTFLSTISHELRTPISSIKMAVQMLTLSLSREGLLSPNGKASLSSNKIAHYLKILNDECNREISLITDLLDLQRLEATNQPVNLQPIVLEPYLHRILYPFQEQAQTRQLTLATEIPSQLPVLISDAQILERILVELLTNACRFTPASERIQVRFYLSAAGHSDEQTCIFEVCNTGVELPPEQLSQIFDKFYRIPSSDPHKHPGIGLGLALVKKLVAQIGGTIRVESAAQKTCFSVELPIKPALRFPSLASVSAPAG